MKKHIAASSVFWAIVLILAAAAFILDGLGVDLGVGFSAWRIALGAVLLAWFVSEIVRLKFAHIFFPLAFLFLLFEAPIATRLLGREDPNIINNWLVLAAALLLTVGFGILFRKRGDASHMPTSKTLYVEAKDLADYRIGDNVGKTEVYVTGRGFYEGAGRITVQDNVGMISIHLPQNWTVVLEKSDNLGTVEIPPQNLANEKSLTLCVRDNVGKVQVVFD